MMPVLDKLASALSVTPTCPRCKRVIPSEDVNVAKDIAFCRNCDLSHSLSALISGNSVDTDVDLSRPPAGTWVQRQGDGLVVGATNRSLGQAFGLLVFALFWNGIVSVFVLLVATATLQHLGLRPPAWFPAAFTKPGHVSVGTTVFLWLFLTPFIAVGMLVFSSALSCLAGRTEIRLQGKEGTLFTGIGPLGFRKRLNSTDVKDVRIEDRTWQDNRGAARHNTQIVIDTGLKPIRFGSMLTADRRRFLAGALKQELLGR